MKVASVCCGYFYPYDRSWEIIVVSQTAIAHIIDSRTIGCCYFFLHIFFFSQGLLISTLCDLPSH